MSAPLDRLFATLPHLLQKGELSQAIQLCQQGLSQSPNSPEIHMALGFLYLETRAPEKAIAAFKSTLNGPALDPLVFRYIAQGYRQLQNWPEVVLWEQELLRYFPQDVEAWMRLADAHLERSQAEAAIACLEKALALSPEREGLHSKLAHLYDKQMDWENAMRHYRKCLSGPDLQFMELQNQLMLEQFDSVEPALNQALTEAPNHLELLFLKARLHLHKREWREAHAIISQLYTVKQQKKWQNVNPYTLGRVEMYPYVFEHQLAQLRELLEAGLVPPEMEQIKKSWEQQLPQLKRLPRFEKTEISCLGVPFLTQHYYSYTAPEFESVLNPELDIAAYEATFEREGLMVIDNLLKPEVYQALYEYCLYSSIWHQAAGTTLVSTFYTGFHPKISFQLAHELQEKFARTIQPHSFTNMWAIKREPYGMPTELHGDESKINFNLWLTPAASNLDPNSGGLVVYTHPAPQDWAFGHYNFESQAPRIRKYLDEVNAPAEYIPYLPNRAVAYKGDYFHETDTMKFKPGIRHQRLVLVMLFGNRSVGRV